MVMKKISLVIPALAFIFLFLTGTALATHEPFVIRYSTALDQQNVEEMTFLIKRTRKRFPRR